MYGKSFAAMYSGSLFGKSAIVFAVWGYVISNMRPSRKDGECYVEINATLLAATFASTVEGVMEALLTLEAPDPASRNTAEDGRRLVLLNEQRHVGPMQYRVVNGATYRAMRDEDERREYNRQAKKAERAAKRVKDVKDGGHGQPRSAQVKEQAKEEGKEEGKSQHLAAERQPSPAEPKKRVTDTGEHDSGIEALGIITRTLEVVAPNLRPDDLTLSQWLRDIHPDPWWISAALCEADLSAARHPRYIAALLRRRADEGWTAGDDPRAYVEYALSPKRRLHLASTQMGAA